MKDLPPAEEIRAELQRIVESRWLKDAHQLQALLAYVIRETLDGRHEGLKEYLIGHAVFGRRADYDPRRDSIVRVQATMLRKRLRSYYEAEGAAAEIVIELPRGGYVPLFHRREELVPADLPVESPGPAAPAGRWTAWRAFVAGALMVLCAWAAWEALGRRPGRSASTLAAERAGRDWPEMWAPFFGAATPAIVTFGVPSFFSAGGLYFRDVRVNANENQPSQPLLLAAARIGVTLQPAADTYTGIGEALATQVLADFLAQRGLPVRAASARRVALSELAGHNLLVVSSLRFRTLLSDLQLPSDFRLLNDEVSDHTNRIQIDNRLPHERSEYNTKPGRGVGTTFAIVSVWPGLDPGNRIVHIGGVHSWATEAATRFLVAPEENRKMAARFAESRRTGSYGKPSPYFQILLRVEGREDRFQNVHYETHHYLKVDRPPVLP